MRRALSRFCVLCLILGSLAACHAGSTVQTPPDAAQWDTPPRPETADLLTRLWLASGETFGLRHTVEVDMSRRSVLLLGYIHLDTAKHWARVVGMTPLGIKLFEYLVTPDEWRVETQVPTLDQHTAECIVRTVRAAFLALPPGPLAPTQDTDRGPRLLVRKGQDRTAWQFAKPKGLLAEIAAWTGDRQSVVTYEDYADFGPWSVPRTITVSGPKAMETTIRITEVSVHASR